jgi:hypothetical protein
MQSERRWLPGWQRIELVELCLERGVTRRQAAAWRCVSVAAVQHVERALAFFANRHITPRRLQTRQCLVLCP